MNRAFTNILCSNVDETARFYQDMLGMTRQGDFGWFILLGHDAMAGFALGILQQDHDSIPSGLASRPAGTILTFVVDDVAPVHRRAVDMGVEIIQPPTNLAYGQRRLMLRDPAGTAVDISAPIR
jgi:catechol 2,3-dioxygenase-like lactoylglutathione lyase family enzyme